MGGILVDDEGDVLHLLGAEPANHRFFSFSPVALVPGADLAALGKWDEKLSEAMVFFSGAEFSSSF